MGTLARIAICALMLTACKSKPPTQQPVVDGPPPSLPAPLERPGGGAWKSDKNLEHPAVGRVWSSSKRDFVSWAELVNAVHGSEMILLGERHDNADHHELQAAIIHHLGQKGRRPAVVFEMVDPTTDHKLEKFISQGNPDPDELRELLSWDVSGWPEWSLYRPVFEAAVIYELPIYGANVSHDHARRIEGRRTRAVRKLRKGLVLDHGLEDPLDAELHADLQDELYESHCKLLPRHHLGGMLLVQRVRDALMAERLEEAAEGQPSGHGALLIAGSGHTREDWAVPYYLARHGHDAATVMFLEAPAVPEIGPPDLRFAELPYDFIVVTPAMEREDPCEQLRDRL